MALVRIDKLQGYIGDTANIDFIRCDDTAFSYYECQSTNFTDTLNFITITGGWGTSPLAYIPTDRTTEFTFESSQFSQDIFELANAATIATDDYGVLETTYCNVDATAHTVTLPFEVKASTVHIRGLEESTTVAAGKFSVVTTSYSISGTSETKAKTVITFNAADVSGVTMIPVTYWRRAVDAATVDVLTTSSTAKGSLAMHFPVYSSGVDCTDAAIKGWVHIMVPRVRVTALPSLSGSYKSAATMGLTFAAIDMKRQDKLFYRIAYEPADANGDINTASTKTAANVKWMFTNTSVS